MELIVTNLPSGIPTDLQELFGYLTGQMFILSDKWKLFHLLFCTSEETAELLRQSGESVFGVLYRSLKDDLTLSICKLADPPSSGKGRENLVFRQLKERLDESQCQELINKLDTHYDTINVKVENLKRWRNKHIAHLDYSTALQGSWKVLPPTSSETFKEAILALGACWNEFYCYFTKEPPVYFTIVTRPNYDPDILLSKLKKALSYDELSKEGKINSHAWQSVSMVKSSQ